MQKNSIRIKERIVILLFIAVAVHLCGLTILVYDQNQMQSYLQKNTYEQVDTYTLYVGTNDQETYQNEIPVEEAEEIISRICLQYVGGYTIEFGKGAWIDEQENLTEETTFILTLQDISEEALEHIMNDICAELNQNTILVEYSKEPQKYYYGEGGSS